MKNISLLLLLFVIYSCNSKQAYIVSDKSATQQTINLFNNMRQLSCTAPMIGHQDALAYGVGWHNDDSRCDLLEAVGDYPAVMGWDLGHIELGEEFNIDTVSFDRMAQHIKRAYAMGAINTISWHCRNPLTQGDSWDVSSSHVVESIAVGGVNHAKFVGWLDSLANFILSLRGADGELIPVIFRPFHELSGNWFWWGAGCCNAEQYIDLWRFTVDYLRGERGLHNLLIAYSTSICLNEAEFMERYPGDDYVDIIGADIYQIADSTSDGSADFRRNMEQTITVLKRVAATHHKIAAITEVGYESIPDPEWFDNVLLPLISDQELSYALLWRNAHNKPHHFYCPHYKHPAAAQLKEAISDGKLLTLGRLDNIYN